MTEARCVVPHCPETTSTRGMEAPDIQWICSTHFALVPKRWRRLYKRARLEGRNRLSVWLWARMKKAVIEAAVGIG